jgi:hypothetical protein
MKLQLDDAGNVVVQDGKPVFQSEDGRSVPFDYPETLKTISARNAEAKANRERYEAAEEKLKLYDGIDPDGARKALETLKNLDSKQLIDAGEVERVKQEAASAYDEKFKSLEKSYKPIREERDSLKGELHQERLGTAFSRSKFIAEKMAIPVDLAQAKFGSQFYYEDGKFKAKGFDGNPLYSQSNPGNVADFEEAMEMLVNSYPYRDSILKGSNASGGGAGGSGELVNGKRPVKRSVWSEMPAAEKAKTALDPQVVLVD